LLCCLYNNFQFVKIYFLVILSYFYLGRYFDEQKSIGGRNCLVKTDMSYCSEAKNNNQGGNYLVIDVQSNYYHSTRTDPIRTKKIVIRVFGKNQTQYYGRRNKGLWVFGLCYWRRCGVLEYWCFVVHTAVIVIHTISLLDYSIRSLVNTMPKTRENNIVNVTRVNYYYLL